MYEIRFHGRGGQGAVLATKILAKALVQEGRFIKAVPSFGFERRGAPVTSFLRFDEKQIRQTTNIYNPDWIVCIDPTLFKTVDIFHGVREGGTLVQATAKHIEDLPIPKQIKKVGLCNAFQIALEIIGRPITNTIMLGALVKTTHVVALDSLHTALQEVAFRDAALGKNVEAVSRGYEETRVYELGGQDEG
ncbi:MAG: ketoisovalerate oxidoreductase [Deltaproteobacteria bacterium]|nr:ketoisovalerate oxidoreductase [Deltaproteobacteria bacterium]